MFSIAYVVFFLDFQAIKRHSTFVFLPSTRWLKKEILIKVTQMLQTPIKQRKLVWWANLFWWKVCSRTNFIKLHQTRFFSSFCYLSIFSENIIHLKCVKIFIKIVSLMDFDENFDAFASAFTAFLYSYNNILIYTIRKWK